MCFQAIKQSLFILSLLGTLLSRYCNTKHLSLYSYSFHTCLVDIFYLIHPIFIPIQQYLCKIHFSFCGRFYYHKTYLSHSFMSSIMFLILLSYILIITLLFWMIEPKYFNWLHLAFKNPPS